MNQAKTLLLIVAMTGLLVLIGDQLGGQSGMVLALAVGLINAVVPGDELEAAAMAAARKLAAKPRATLLMIKALMKTPAEPVEDRLSREAAVFDECLGRPELKEAVAAFAEKRPPDFSKCR